MGYVVKLQGFEGPLDILLQLISKSKMRIEDVSLADITNQYMLYLSQMQELDMEIASEFLVMAATLLHIKSLSVLPDTRLIASETENNPEKELKQKLMEYNDIKQAALRLDERASLHSAVYYRISDELINNEEYKPVPDNISTNRLSQTMSSITKRLKKQANIPVVHTIKRDHMTIKAKIGQLKLFLEKYRQIGFSELIAKRYNPPDIVLTFLALLEMAADGFLELKQIKPFDDIVVRKKEFSWLKRK